MGMEVEVRFSLGEGFKTPAAFGGDGWRVEISVGL